jgi:hypothetical protein
VSLAIASSTPHSAANALPPVGSNCGGYRLASELTGRVIGLWSRTGASRIAWRPHEDAIVEPAGQLRAHRMGAAAPALLHRGLAARGSRSAEVADIAL